MCGEPNQIIDEMIMQKQNYEQEQRRLEERKQFCSECYSKLDGPGDEIEFSNKGQYIAMGMNNRIW